MRNIARREVAGMPERVATRVAFFIAGFATSAWAPLVPYAQARLGIDEGVLGILLLCLGMGSLSTMPLSGYLAGRFGCRRVILVAALTAASMLPFLAVIDNFFLIALVLLIFGGGVGMVDVTVNIQAVIVERAHDKSLMSGFHGLFSVGGIAGAGGVSLLLAAGASPLQSMLGVGVIIVALLVISGRNLLPYGSDGDSACFVLPRGVVLFVGVLAFIMFLTEGAMLDWSAVFLTVVRDLDTTHGGLGYAVFAAAMTVGRLSGDFIVSRLGGWKILFLGSLCTALGLMTAVVVPSWMGALAGFTLIGLGASNIVPVLYSAMGRQTVMPTNLAVAAISTLGYSGILLGPALIGFIAQISSLPTAFIVMTAGVLFVAASARLVTR